ncbi:unnamed protein product [Acanthoscelides obtectus]|uniref:Amino acid transporter transmembrane domain-containing protein n=1 Tax=Acanthoscelides obtectus TaxID=200917 RepID=A0A9P0P630_ACAOB|nr:unnamed protein product [Acanthoscelides obtectus]CAK1657651.1 Proton-coupled amino acid transporter-like protein CG1139 [Acanthoscelides obtectus]
MLIFLLPLILINYIRSLKYLAPLSSIANFVTVASFGIILYYLIQEDITFENRQAIGDWRDYPLFFGTALFALEAISMIMPLENEMKTPQCFGGTCGVLNIGMTVIVLLYVAMGLLGYLAYGKDVGGSISYTIGSDIPALICKLMLVFAIFVTHSLQMYVSIDIVWRQYLLPKYEKSPFNTVYEYIIRTLLVTGCFLLAAAVPYLDLFISLFGALTLSGLGLGFPAIIEISLYWYELKGAWGKWIIGKNILIALFAIIGLVIGTYTSLEKIILKFGEDTSEPDDNV